jgi:hypothetical protein
LGGLIFFLLFPASACQKLTNAAPGDLFLRVDEQLVHVPWELAVKGQDFLLTKFRIGRQVLTQQPPLSRSARHLKVSKRLKMLLTVDPTETLPAAAEEAERLCSLLDACGELEVTVLGGKRLRKLELLQALSECDLVHYAGHARFDAAQPSRSGWVLHDAVLTASELSRVAHPPLLVFANACQAGASSPWQANAIYEGQAFGIGSAFRWHPKLHWHLLRYSRCAQHGLCRRLLFASSSRDSHLEKPWLWPGTRHAKWLTGAACCGPVICTTATPRFGSRLRQRSRPHHWTTGDVAPGYPRTGDRSTVSLRFHVVHLLHLVEMLWTATNGANRFFIWHNRCTNQGLGSLHTGVF